VTRDVIEVIGATTHNLKSVDCSFPHRALTVVTGVSGSGKSSLAFETLYAEGQRRYLQTFSSYARQYLDKVSRPPVDAIRHLLPSVALQQHNPVTQPRSTVGTVTEVSSYLALLFTGIGQVHCDRCDRVVSPATPPTIADALLAAAEGQRVVLTGTASLQGDDDDRSAGQILAGLASEGHTRIWREGAAVRLEDCDADALLGAASVEVLVDRLRLKGRAQRLFDSCEAALRLGRGTLDAHLVDSERTLRFHADWLCNGCDRAFEAPTPPLFSFNTPLGACPKCSGFGRAMGIDWDRVVPDAQRSIAGGAVAPMQHPRGRNHQLGLEQLCLRHDISIDAPWAALDASQRRRVIDGDETYGGVRAFVASLEQDRTNPDIAALLARCRSYTTCDRCEGTRYSANARAVRIRGRHAGELGDTPLGDLADFFTELNLDEAEVARSALVLEQVERRLTSLVRIGLGYLTLSRLTRTLSAGEYQRILLSGCLNRGLVDTCYVLDEPTAGLHARDSRRLLAALKELCELGNTVVVVEHEPEIIKGADRVVELGPTGGNRGGHVLYEGGVSALRDTDTPTGAALRGEIEVAEPSGRELARWIEVIGARVHNLKHVDARFPRGAVTMVTGVSGSGKSSLVFDVLCPSARRLIEQKRPVDARLCDEVTGLDGIAGIIAMDRDTLSPGVRSTVLTSSGVLEPIRKALAATDEAKGRGLTPFHFSTNVRGGRCDRCAGLGVERVDMHFMADVEVTCDACLGRRFKPHVLEIELRGLTIDQIHHTTVAEALCAFDEMPAVIGPLVELDAVGLGYLELGQPVRTLSGGERQRLRIARHLAERKRGEEDETLFLFDEPSVGLHPSDVAVLSRVFRRLADAGQTVIAVEHNLELVASADWVVDLGPEGGVEGGSVVVAGPPAVVGDTAESHTGRFLSSLAD